MVGEMKLEISLMKEKNTSLFQETKVLSREVDLKNKEIKELKADIQELKLKLLNEVKANGPYKLKISELNDTIDGLKYHIVPLEEKLTKKKEKLKEIKKC